MRLRSRFFILMGVVFLSFTVLVWLYSDYLARHINEQWGARVSEKQVLIDKHRTLLPLIRELALARQMAAEPALVEMALDDENPAVRKRALDVLERYRKNFQGKSYFAAITKTGHYFFNDAEDHYHGKQLRYTLSPDKEIDRWFYATVESKLDYQVNVDPDIHLGTTRVWINVAVKHKGEVVALIGTGMDISSFIHETVDASQRGVLNLFVDRDLAIQMHRNQKLIDYASITKAVDKRRRVNVLLTDPKDVNHLSNVMKQLENNPDKIETLWVTYDGKRELLGVAFLPEVGWFDLTLMDVDTLTLLDRLNIAPFLAVMFLLALLAVGTMLHRLILKPLHLIGNTLNRIEQGDEAAIPPQVGTAEIAQLSTQFRTMTQAVRSHENALEEKITARTQQLSAELTERKKAEVELRRSETLLRTLYENSSDAVMLLNDRGFFQCNHAALTIFGCTDEGQILSKQLVDVLPAQQPNGAQSQAIAKQHIATAKRSGSHHFEWHCKRLDNNEEFPADVLLNSIELDGISVIQAVMRDISDRKRAEKRIENLAYYDSLTHLHNRFIFNDRLAQTIAISKRHNRHAGLIVMDLDNFKQLNDLYGHSAGDQLLIDVANRLKACVREADTVARIGGDEFVIILSELGGDREEAVKNATMLAEKMRVTLEKPYHLQIRHNGIHQQLLKYHCPASIGVVVFNQYTGDQADLFNQADAAMYESKHSGGNRVRFFKAGTAEDLS